jgi:hypothetical protein
MLDGRNRREARRRVGVEPSGIELNGTASPVVPVRLWIRIENGNTGLIFFVGEFRERRGAVATPKSVVTATRTP